MTTISPIQEMMRDHGLLRRIMLIYDKLLSSKTLDMEVIHACATITNEFVGKFHGKLEEKYIFPVVAKTHKKLIDELIYQHKVGRVLTSNILNLSSLEKYTDEDIANLVIDIQEFCHMYKAHESREDTIVFLEFDKMVSQQEKAKLGMIFKEIEESMFGENGFESILEVISGLEKKIGIDDLSVYTINGVV